MILASTLKTQVYSGSVGNIPEVENDSLFNEVSRQIYSKEVGFPEHSTWYILNPRGTVYAAMLPGPWLTNQFMHEVMVILDVYD